MKNRKRNNRGMMTIEACVIVPLSLMITFLLLWNGMLLYDRAAVNYAVSAAVIRGGCMAEASNEEISTFVQQKIAEMLEHKLVLMECPEAQVRVEYGSITASVRGTLDAPPLAGFTGDWTVESQHSADRMRASQIVRTIQRVDRLAEKYTDAEEETDRGE